jgi:hypothetical protein
MKWLDIFFQKFTNIKFHEDAFRRPLAVICIQPDRWMDKNSNFERHSAGMRTRLKSGFSKTIKRGFNTLMHAPRRAITFAIVLHPLYIQRWMKSVGTNNRKAHGIKTQLICKRDRNYGALPDKYSNFCATIVPT